VTGAPFVCGAAWLAAVTVIGCGHAPPKPELSRPAAGGSTQRVVLLMGEGAAAVETAAAAFIGGTDAQVDVY
jgi:hypothetical protein